ncbi:hypothetical protein PHYBLDRAFT_165737 [Phycomyces blakesleeanus NRRL 1555(-)]|uniref:Uncharacterized protein n=1 Tax=Phycomyces blakesleeanus (strain ATCC 8743b / DSM 1359 / FGSC 10004 / NBRC 33097 / NRRL 1555) TaxID=763407 RepID=A0A167NF13_PHYB8|nr:hypothetical protein PHYBLDRAFT_165737 [Phycomyces blakesleeanus NRRL 1555(-)]OAD75749.1 hypothetical protein PHYBLDRAFT_165737 [Phycomyces blakesleeanus NRRL 1555(-)]|eukprot:XP_018293789.1 hypothetical protein PHYBLDRAFT_165737 [Phycomyces blakesleeanus NRRL 1555(-)]
MPETKGISAKTYMRCCNFAFKSHIRINTMSICFDNPYKNYVCIYWEGVDSPTCLQSFHNDILIVTLKHIFGTLSMKGSIYVYLVNGSPRISKPLINSIILLISTNNVSFPSSTFSFQNNIGYMLKTMKGYKHVFAAHIFGREYSPLDAAYLLIRFAEHLVMIPWMSTH